MTNPYLPVLIMLAVALAMALGGLGVSAFIGPKAMNRVKLADYECGVDPTPQAEQGGRFPIRFYLVAMTFIVFDIEVVFMVPWALNFAELQTFGLVTMLAFITVITVPFIYELRRGGLDWD